MRAADLVVGHAKKRSPSESIFPFRWLALPPSRRREPLACYFGSKDRLLLSFHHESGDEI